ncbi:LysM peptidoglycan-binding domain-containing protein [Deinococcus sp. 6YEL10]|uniref:LysM peptidoglycan-binding domain-containing protein n=1 Tax=Deinococcus sp. 6YEL10 TaxID=2745870 RepID=UPI001E63D0C8|nr:LysM peptidoglycan-binding domain-containing protein [Deinococcus sp. 6YEL10]MCD0162514.1 LysM peptidoglycan-binding domain-containing protein [Deinococcus sp. 6YEL10]
MRRTSLLFLILLGLTGPASPALAASAPRTVTVRAGDTLYRIATRTGTSVAALRAANGLKGDVIRAGQVLRLSGSASVSAAAPAAATSAARRHTVKRGDTLSLIARRYGVSVSALKAGNSLSSSVIRTGQILKIPARSARPAPAPTTEVRVVYRYVRMAAGDTPPRFAARYRLSVDHLRRLNGLNTARLIVPGRKLLVPSRVPVPIPPRPVRAPVSFKRLSPLNVPVRIANVDLRHRDTLVAPVLASPRAAFGSGARVSQLARNSGAKVVINGSYFHPQTYAPAGDIVMQGRMLTWGRIPMALAITPDNRATIRASTTPLLLRPLDTTWAGMETVVATGPRILSGGQLITRYSAAFRDPALFGRAARSAIGLISNRDLVLVSTHMKLTTTEMGRVMARLGIRDALLLDGGSSTGIAWNGQAALDSVRKVSYGIGVFTDYTGRRYAR